MRKLSLITLSLFILLGNLFSSTLKVTVSAPPFIEIADKIGGMHIEVSSFLESNQNHHTVEIKPSQMMRISKADIYFKSGLPFETLLLNRIQSMYPKIKIIDVTSGVEKIVAVCIHEGDHEHEPHHEKFDPHVWMDPLNAITIGKNMLDAFISADPSNAQIYIDNYNRFVTEIETLDNQFKALFLQFKGRTFYVYHPAFGYFAKRYGITEYAIEANGKPPPPRMLAKLIKEKGKINTLFIQPQYDASTLKMITDSLNAKVDKLDPLSSRYIENLKTVAEKIAESFANTH